MRWLPSDGPSYIRSCPVRGPLRVWKRAATRSHGHVHYFFIDGRRDRFVVCFETLQISRDCLADITQRLVARCSLRNASRKRRNLGHKYSVFVALKHDSEFHWLFPYWPSNQPSAKLPGVAHRIEEVVERTEAHVHVAALLVADGRPRLRRVRMAGVNHSSIVQIFQRLVEAVIHRLGIGPRQIDASARAHEQRIARNQVAAHQETLRARRMTGSVEKLPLQIADIENVTRLDIDQIRITQPRDSFRTFGLIFVDVDLDLDRSEEH